MADSRTGISEKPARTFWEAAQARSFTTADVSRRLHGLLYRTVRQFTYKQFKTT
jgi:hypothetical protein